MEIANTVLDVCDRILQHHESKKDLKEAISNLKPFVDHFINDEELCKNYRCREVLTSIHRYLSQLENRNESPSCSPLSRLSKQKLASILWPSRSVKQIKTFQNELVLSISYASFTKISEMSIAFRSIQNSKDYFPMVREMDSNDFTNPNFGDVFSESVTASYESLEIFKKEDHGENIKKMKIQWEVCVNLVKRCPEKWFGISIMKDGFPVAFLIAVREMDEEGRHYVYVAQVAVDIRHQRCHYGSFLASILQEKANLFMKEPRFIGLVRRKNHTAKSFYEKLGAAYDDSILDDPPICKDLIKSYSKEVFTGLSFGRTVLRSSYSSMLQ